MVQADLNRLIDREVRVVLSLIEGREINDGGVRAFGGLGLLRGRCVSGGDLDLFKPKRSKGGIDVGGAWGGL